MTLPTPDSIPLTVIGTIVACRVAAGGRSGGGFFADATCCDTWRIRAVSCPLRCCWRDSERGAFARGGRNPGQPVIWFACNVAANLDVKLRNGQDQISTRAFSRLGYRTL